MKNSKRRLLSSLAIVLILILSTTVLSGCYVIKSGKMNRVEGTYQLTHYSGDSDWLTERGIELYMVIRSDGTGYYAYKDNNTEPYIAELRCRFVQDEEESGKYSYVEIDFEGNGKYEKLGINARTFNTSTNLNARKAKWKPLVWGEAPEIDYYIDIDFIRIDRATDLSAITEVFGNVPVLPHGAKNAQGAYEMYEIVNIDSSSEAVMLPEDPFVYFYVDIDLIKGEGKAQYMLKADEVAQSVSFDVKIEKDGTGGYFFKFGNVDVKRDSAFASYSNYLVIPYSTDGGSFNLMRFGYIGQLTEADLDDRIESDYSQYLANKPITEE